MGRDIDLHIHTSASDGTFSPEQVIQMGSKLGLKCVAITDHDTIDGVEEALQAGQKLGLEIIPGVELSVYYPKGEMHILGYYLDYNSKLLKENLELLQQYRGDRNPKIIEKLNELGIAITLQEVTEKAGGKLIGRPHIGSVLKDKGHVEDIQEAFDKYLAKGSPAYIPKERLTPKEAIDLIHEAKGIAVLAHPKQLGLDQAELESLIAQLANYGLDGIEAYYTTHNTEEVDLFVGLANKYNLLITGGSDFHGDNKPNVKLGSGKGNLSVPYALIEKIKGYSARYDTEVIVKSE